VGILLLSSNAFFDYTSSGLENPLGYLVVACFLYLFDRLAFQEEGEAERPRLVFGLLLTAGVGIVYRHDMATLLLIPTLYVLWTFRRVYTVRQWAGVLLCCGAPFLLWSLFSTVYFGTPLPNTAYAKLGLGLPRSELWHRGFTYLLTSLRYDTLTPVILVSVLAGLIVRRSGALLALAAGLLLNITYVVSVGGDFMMGRFLSYAYLYAAVAGVLYLLDGEGVRRPVPATALLAAVLGYMLLYAHTPLNSPLLYSNKQLHGEIADERGFYFYHNSLSAYLTAPNQACRPSHPLSIAGCDAAETDEQFMTRPAIGMYGYQAGLGKIIIDPLALTDPLLARLPADPGAPQRIGHFKRALPEGYLEHLADP
jgi:arabinofuranosyltransferase